MPRIAIRCDGGAAIGAGHVGRCLPVASALRERGAHVTFVGGYDGIAAWLLDGAQVPRLPTGDGACGLDAENWDAALVDLYMAGRGTGICELAARLPIATLGEATRCGSAGIWVDYHAGSPREAGPRRLGGPEYAPVDPRFAAARRARDTVDRILVSTGASVMFGDIAARMTAGATAAFPTAEVLQPTPPFDLAEIAPTIDLAVVGAGMTTYELASAGIPLVAVALVENQRVVIDGCRATGIAVPVDGIGQDPFPGVVAALTRMQQSDLRTELAATAAATVDGRGAGRIADALLAAWTPGSREHSDR